jgi:predicted  nucleic acid-binding Zn-ribbon protein
MNKPLKEMTVDDLKEALKNLSERKGNLNSDIQKFSKRISNLKKNIKEIEKEEEILSTILELKEVVE